MTSAPSNPRQFTILEGTAAPLMRENIDTDVIIRINRLVGSDQKNLGPWAFEAMRYRPDGSENPEFVFNQPRYRGASILLGGRNFGCGSSREGAVSAIHGMGVRCVIAPSFGDIFFGNCFQNGVLPIVLPQKEVDRLAEEARTSTAGATFVVDLEAREIRTPGQRVVPFNVDPIRREALLLGLDPIAATRQYDANFAAFQARDKQERPWVYL